MLASRGKNVASCRVRLVCRCLSNQICGATLPSLYWKHSRLTWNIRIHDEIGTSSQNVASHGHFTFERRWRWWGAVLYILKVLHILIVIPDICRAILALLNAIFSTWGHWLLSLAKNWMWRIKIALSLRKANDRGFSFLRVEAFQDWAPWYRVLAWCCDWFGLLLKLCSLSTRKCCLIWTQLL